MNNDTIYFAVLAAAAAYYMTKPKKANAAVPGGATELNIPNAAGWRYFSDGTAISPDGTYYKHGQMIWNPMM